VGGLAGFRFEDTEFGAEEEAGLDATLAALCKDVATELKAAVSAMKGAVVQTFFRRLENSKGQIVHVRCNPRSEFTLLHNLISLHPKARPVLYCKHLNVHLRSDSRICLVHLGAQAIIGPTASTDFAVKESSGVFFWLILCRRWMGKREKLKICAHFLKE